MALVERGGDEPPEMPRNTFIDEGATRALYWHTDSTVSRRIPDFNLWEDEVSNRLQGYAPHRFKQGFEEQPKRNDEFQYAKYGPVAPYMEHYFPRERGFTPDIYREFMHHLWEDNRPPELYVPDWDESLLADNVYHISRSGWPPNRPSSAVGVQSYTVGPERGTGRPFYGQAYRDNQQRRKLRNYVDGETVEMVRNNYQILPRTIDDSVTIHYDGDYDNYDVSGRRVGITYPLYTRSREASETLCTIM